ncbi:MAG: ABC transporter permease, partial [Alphaproteobacteria bacterium]|nr:ABC transporter permease [Alphaproteobacteria bacterium]
MTDTKDPRGPETPDEIPHFISEEPFDPDVEVVLTEEQEKYYMAGQWQLMWWKLRRHKIAVAAGIFLLLM